MKKFIPFSSKVLMIIMIMVLILLAGEGCSGGNEAMEIKTASGTIVIVGNEPFTYPALQIADDEIYVIDCSKEDRQTFFENQGKQFTIYYNVMMDGPAGKTLNMVKYEKLKVE